MSAGNMLYCGCGVAFRSPFGFRLHCCSPQISSFYDTAEGSAPPMCDLLEKSFIADGNLLSLIPLSRGHPLMNLLIASALCLFLAPPVPTVPHAIGVAHTEQVDLGYETFGTVGTALPIIAINGGPGLSHAYMMQNDLWERIGRNRLVVLYDQRGTGVSKRIQAGAP